MNISTSERPPELPHYLTSACGCVALSLFVWQLCFRQDRSICRRMGSKGSLSAVDKRTARRR